ncbi:integrase arm-type DNA-binding domain-containing protein [Sphingomonas sp. ZB1N12]|uniref:tyrosine-type recombinase/integrase n=1 Tax=Sphingomonas arabinosi TaxID=3096160 RepID=UPI002FC59724
MPSGYRSWRMKFRFAGNEKSLVFGSYPNTTLLQARAMRENAAKLLRDGVDPSVHKVQQAAAQVARVGATFKMIAEDWLASQDAIWSKRYAQNVKNSFVQDVYLKLGHLPVDAITTPLVPKVLRPVEERGAIETAHRIRQRISEVFARAIGSSIVAADPAAVAQRALSPIKRGKQPAVRTVEAARIVLRKVEEQPAHPLTKLASRFLSHGRTLWRAAKGRTEGIRGAGRAGADLTYPGRQDETGRRPEGGCGLRIHRAVVQTGGRYDYRRDGLLGEGTADLPQRASSQKAAQRQHAEQGLSGSRVHGASRPARLAIDVLDRDERASGRGEQGLARREEKRFDLRGRCINLHLREQRNTAVEVEVFGVTASIPATASKATEKLAGEAGVLARYLGVQLRTNEIGGKRTGRFRVAIGVSGRSFILWGGG